MYLSACLCVLAWCSQLSEIYRDSEKLQQMKHIKEAEGIHKTQSRFYSAPKSHWGKGRRRKEGWFKIYSPPQTVTASPTQLHRCPGPVWPIRMICPLSFHHPPQDNTGGREQDFQTFGNAPLRVPVGANCQLCSQTQWPFCFAGLLQYQNGKLHRWTNEQTEGGQLSQGRQTVMLLATIYVKTI